MGGCEREVAEAEKSSSKELPLFLERRVLCRELVEKCLEIVPDWRQALMLKKAVEDCITKDGVIGIGIAAAAVGLLAGGLAAALSRKK